MTDIQTRKYNMAKSVKGVLDNNASHYASIGAMTAKKSELDEQLVEIEGLQLEQEVDTKGATEQKNQSRTHMCDLALEICKPMAAYAKEVGNEVLLGEIDFERTDLLQGKASESKEKCQLVHDRANAHISDLEAYGIDPGKTSQLQAAINTFSDLLALPRTTTATGESATMALAVAITNLMDILESLDELMANFRTSQPDFYNAYFSARRIVDTGTRTVLLQLKVHDSASNIPLSGVRIAIPEQQIIASTNKEGNARLMSNEMKPGNVTLDLSFQGYDPLRVSQVIVGDGSTVKLNLAMVKSV